MSFNCDLCKNHDAGKPIRTITKARMVEHKERRRNEETGREEILVVGSGPQIVQEMNLCDNCG